METKDVEAAPGVVSLMRTSVKKVINIGSVMVFAGIILSGISLILNKGFELTSVYSLLVATGAGMITGALASKAWQSQAESRNTTE